MNVIDKIVTEWAYRCKKGYPDMNNPEDLKILNEIYAEYGIVVEEKKEEPEEYTIQDLLNIIQQKQELLDGKFISKIYHQILTKGKKLGTTISTFLRKKDLQASENEIFNIIHQTPGLEEKVAEFLQDPSRHVTISQLRQGTNIVETCAEVTKLPPAFISTMLKAGRASEGGKGVGAGEALLAFIGKNAKKLGVGDVEIEGKEVEVKGDKGRLIGRSESLTQLYDNLAKLGPEARTVRKGKEALHTYIPYVISQNSESQEDVKKLLKSEFNIIRDIDITSSEELRKAFLEWYVDYFFNNEAKSASYIFVLLGTDYKMYNKEEFKQAALTGNLIFQNFTATNKSPQILSFA